MKQVKFQQGQHIETNQGIYFGKVEDVGIFYNVRRPDGQMACITSDQQDFYREASKLDEDSVWDVLPAAIIREIKSRNYSAKRIRHVCYKLLGGAGVDTKDQDNKDRLASLVRTIAGAMDIDLWD